MKNQNDGQVKVSDTGELNIASSYWINWIVKTIKIQSRGCPWFLHSMSFYFKEWHTHTHQKYRKGKWRWNGNERKRIWGRDWNIQRSKIHNLRFLYRVPKTCVEVFNQIQSLGLNQSQIQMLPILYQSFIWSMSFLAKSFHWSYP